VGERQVGSIGSGLLVLIGVGLNDSEADAQYLADKTAELRIFPDHEGKMNLSLVDTGGHVLVISQFTLYGDCRKGRRPSWHLAAEPDLGNSLYLRYCQLLEAKGIRVERGEFGAMMDVELVNAGPVTMLLDSGREF
jgi:D-tyrosyl-tRNA(Tyr) deacylase